MVHVRFHIFMKHVWMFLVSKHDTRYNIDETINKLLRHRGAGAHIGILPPPNFNTTYILLLVNRL